MQRVNPLCPTIRRKRRKIGRNEPCPCGRTKQRRVVESDKAHVYKYVDLGVDAGILVDFPVKYKHCCGNIINQRPVTRAKRSVADATRKALGFKKDRRSLLQKLAALFKKERK